VASPPADPEPAHASAAVLMQIGHMVFSSLPAIVLIAKDGTLGHGWHLWRSMTVLFK
jgi:hypothetical protein